MERTIKLPYKIESEKSHQRIREYVQNYSNVVRFTYNRLLDSPSGLSTKELTALQKQMNNVFIDSHFLNSAQYDAKAILKAQRDLEKEDGKSHKVIFGSKQNFIDRAQGKISREEFLRRRLRPIFSIGEACKNSNRKFQIQDENYIIFQPCRKEHFLLKLPRLKKNLKRDLKALKQLQDDCEIPITYKLDLDYIYISFDDARINAKTCDYKVRDRIFAVDLNPNYIGWSIVDWRSSSDYHVVDSGVISNKQLNDEDKKLHVSSDSPQRKKIQNKRTFENIDSAKYLVNLADHYQCSMFALEDLNIKTKDAKRGKHYNRLVNNQWNRLDIYSQIEKRCNNLGIPFQKVEAAYSSFQGNLRFRETYLPDMCLSSIEIGRRGYEFYHQHVLKDTPKQKNIILDNSEDAVSKITQSLEELSFQDAFKDLKDLYYKLKNSQMNYRVPLEGSCLLAVSRKKSIKSKILLYGSL